MFLICSHPANYSRSLSFGTKNHRRAVISISSVSLRHFHVNTINSNGRGEAIEFFPDRNTQIQTRTAAALSSVSPQQEHTIFSFNRICMLCERGIWSAGKLQAGRRSLAPITVIKVPSGASQHHFAERPIFSWKTQHAGARNIEFRTHAATGVVRVCGSERSNFSAQALCAAGGRASHQTLRLLALEWATATRVLRYGSATQESRFGSHSSFGSPRQQSASPAS
jgi:hypothetical protein